MIELERTIRVSRPAVAVARYLADFSNAQEWDAGTKSCTRLDQGPVRVGARWRYVSQFGGLETELRYTLIRRDPLRLTFRGENETFTATDDLILEDQGGGTLIHYRVSFRVKGFAAWVTPLVRSSLDKLADDTMTQMKSALERH
jgi:carbon monoxide dehydrogenase subunit G